MQINKIEARLECPKDGELQLPANLPPKGSGLGRGDPWMDWFSSEVQGWRKAGHQAKRDIPEDAFDGLFSIQALGDGPRKEIKEKFSVSNTASRFRSNMYRFVLESPCVSMVALISP